MKIKIIVTFLFTLALRFNVIAAERVENEKKTVESVFAVAKQMETFDADVLKAEMNGVSMSESAKLVKMATKIAKAQTQRQSGIVKWYDVKKGFGFIAQDDGGKDLAVEANEIQGAKFLVEGQRVEYDIKEGKKGFQASNVTIKD